jgi:cation:H+ antiporter
MFRDLPLLANVAAFALAAGVVWFAGTRLARYADGIASATGIGREFLGMLLLGGVTSLPEIAVATTATLQGTPALSVNDVLGSAAINIVILALADAAVGRGALTGMLGSPTILLQGVLGIVIMALTVGAVLAGDVLIFGIGAWCWLMLGAYLVGIGIVSKSRAGEAWKPTLKPWVQADDDASQPSGETLRRLVMRSAAAGAAILVAGFVLARSGDALAHQSGLGEGFFGAVVLGFSTSLPEVSTVLAAVRMRQYAMAVSDVFGTNVFNVTIIVLVDALHPGGPVLLETGRFASFAALLALVLTAIYLGGMIERRDRTVLRMGVDSVAVLLLYAAGVAVLYTLR